LTAVIGQTVVGTRVEPPSQINESVRSGWARSYVRRLAVTDAGVIVISVAIAHFARFGTDPSTLPSEVSVYSYAAVLAVLIIAWFSRADLFRSRERRVVGTGVDEFHRVARASTARDAGARLAARSSRRKDLYGSPWLAAIT
jgi:hypothetical protein